MHREFISEVYKSLRFDVSDFQGNPVKGVIFREQKKEAKRNRNLQTMDCCNTSNRATLTFSDRESGVKPKRPLADIRQENHPRHFQPKKKPISTASLSNARPSAGWSVRTFFSTASR